MSDKTADEILSETDELSPQEFYDKYGYTQSHALLVSDPDTGKPEAMLTYTR